MPHRNLLPREVYRPVSDPLVKAYQLAVNIEATKASIDGLIDDIITTTIAEPFWVKRAKNTALLVINTIFRLLHPYAYLKQDAPLSLRNIAGEFQLAKRKTCLGWEIQTRYIWVLLPRGNRQPGNRKSAHP